jgi:hypothetical protein
LLLFNFFELPQMLTKAIHNMTEEMGYLHSAAMASPEGTMGVSAPGQDCGQGVTAV